MSIESAGENLRVTVMDSGLGIPKSDLPHVFDKYYQTSTKATAGEKGSGLGLAIVRELVLLHGGQIDVSSEVNRGTIFTVHLPHGAHREFTNQIATENAAEDTDIRAESQVLAAAPR